jgi:hypothetical protein
MNPFETIHGDSWLALSMFSIYKWKLLIECLGECNLNITWLKTICKELKSRPKHMLMKTQVLNNLNLEKGKFLKKSIEIGQML